ncbi:MAG: tRNA threonylcarbamoyladenosine dehydratase [Clostridia bacterium]|nr:tRNA threonylcarbamoyladenosine dehydratase [Clostridia bacterium]
MEKYQRTEKLIEKSGVEKLKKAKVLVFGVGGVGGYTVEALARAGVGFIDVIDGDKVSESNINRQIIALHSTIGQPKVEVIKARVKDINPEIKVSALNLFYLPENADKIDFGGYDYIVDAVDTVSAKISIILKAKEAGVPVISAMGAGNKLDATKFEITDIFKTEGCPLARVMRKELKTRGITNLWVVYSKEPPIKQTGEDKTPGSISYVPPVSGLLIAQKVISDLLDK